jgi:hypothetical protein
MESELQRLRGEVLQAAGAEAAATRQNLEIYSQVALADAQQAYDQTIGRFPV